MNNTVKKSYIANITNEFGQTSKIEILDFNPTMVFRDGSVGPAYKGRVISFSRPAGSSMWAENTVKTYAKPAWYRAHKITN